MARDQKTKSKASQAQKNATSRQRVAPATPTPTQASDSAQTIPDTTDVVPAESQAANTIITTDVSDATNTTVTTDTARVSNEATNVADIQEEKTAIQQATANDQPVVWSGLQPSWPTWPTSKPGPHSKPPAPGMRSINKLRPEQFAEVGYNQQTGEPVTQSPLRSLPDERTTGPTSFDLPTAQDVLGKRKQRL